MISEIAIIGVGNLGLAMAEGLMAAGIGVTGYRRGPMDDLVAAGGRAAGSIGEAVRDSDAVIICVPDAAALEDAVSRDDGLLSTLRLGQVVIETSTTSVAEKRRQAARVAEAGGILLDCPVSGTPVMMRAGRAAVFASGERAAFDRIAGVLEAIAPRVTYVGEVGAGTVLKHIATALAGVHCVATAEAMAYAERAGVDRAAVLAGIKGSPATSAILEIRGEMMVAQDYRRGAGGLAGFLSNIELVLDAVGEAGIDWPLLEATRQLYAAAVAAGYGDQDQASVVEYLAGKER